MSPYLFLAIAIILEVIATSMLKASAGFTRPWPTAGLIAGYLGAFYFLSRTLDSIPTGVAYAIWSGVGIVLIALAGWVFFKQTLDLPAVLGMALIAAGVVVINVFSKSTSH